MKKIKLKLHAIIYLIIVANVSNAQNPYLFPMNTELRKLFANISYPDPNIKFLYDRSVKQTDTTFYARVNYDTSYATNWFNIYEDVYYAAHDTMPLPRIPSVINYMETTGNDTIPFGLIDLEYYVIKPIALSTPTYFIFDTINNLLFDEPSRPGSPFASNERGNNIFTASPLKEDADGATQVFKINPQYLFIDFYNNQYYNAPNSLYIDFDDGNGFIAINSTSLNYITINYPLPGLKIIKTAIKNSAGAIVKLSTSSITVNFPTGYESDTPDGELNLDGLNVSYWNSCDEKKFRKAIIYLEGFDLGDGILKSNRTAQEVYEQMIKANPLADIQNFGYDIYVVDWENSRIDIRFNAAYVVQLIEYLKQQYKENDQQFIIIGESMGGLVGRYALCFMESPFYATGNYTPLFQDLTDPSNAAYLATHPNLLLAPAKYRDKDALIKKHRTRLLITLDSPHQGANVPLSIQLVYANTMKTIGGIMFGPIQGFAAKAFNEFLDAKAARQMLVYHYNTKFPIAPPAFGYNASPSYYGLQASFKQLGDFPKECKIMALSGGSISGKNQGNYFTGGSRSANDRLIDFKVKRTFKLFKQTLPFLEGDIELRTNPLLAGPLWKVSAKAYIYYPKLKKWKITWQLFTTLPLLNIQENALNTRPVCTSPGGFIGPKTWIKTYNGPTSENYIFEKLLKWFPNGFYSNNACITNTKNKTTYGLCTDGLQFCFVPVQSALNIDNGLFPYGTNFQTLPPAFLLNQTPFDVIVGNHNGFGYVDSWGNSRLPDYIRINDNFNHLDFRNDYIYNISNLPAHNPTIYEKENFAYYSCQQNNCFTPKRGFLNLEIGDEELYLENFTIKRPADFQAEFQVNVNKRNPHYTYVGIPSSPLLLNGIYSKKKPFITLPTTSPTVFYGFSDPTLSNTGFTYLPPNSLLNSYVYGKQKLVFCCIKFSANSVRMAQNSSTGVSVESESYFKLFPNPNSGNDLTLQFIFEEQTIAIIELFDITGRLLKSQITENSKEINFEIKDLDLQSGVYTIKVSNGNESLVQKLIINK